MRTAQTLSFGPLLFQAARLLRDRGILELLRGKNPTGATVAQVCEVTGLSDYAAVVLLEAGMAADLVERSLDGEFFRATRAGVLLDRDPLTRANMNFVGDVCYRAAEHLGDSLDEGRPAGLKELGDWSTVYEGLLRLPEPARQSWLEFDHFYSDDTFPIVVPEVLSSEPKSILDVGGNTGKFTLQVMRHSEAPTVTVADLPQQLAACRANVEEAGFSERVNFHPVSMLSADAELPSGHDVIWMSQFLSCFSEAEVVHVLQTAARAMGKDTRLYILDNLWDEQKNDVAELCLQATSLYFTCVANGTSRMYDGKTLRKLISRAGLQIDSERHHLGWGHSLLACRLGVG